MIRLQEIEDLFPGFGWLKHDSAVVALREFPETLRALIGFIQPVAEAFGDDGIAAGDEYSDGAVVLAQMFFRRKAVDEQERDGKDNHVRLRDGNKTIVSTEQNDTIDFIWMFAREIRRDAGAERFADEVNGAIGREQFERFIGSGIKRVFGGLAGAVFIAGIFDDVDVQRSSLLNRVRIMAAFKRAAGVSVSDDHLTLRGLGGRHSFPANWLASGTGPTRQILRGGVLLDFRRTHVRRKIDHTPLQGGAADTKNEIHSGIDFQPSA